MAAMTAKTTRACSQQTEQMLEGQLRTIDADYRRPFEQRSDAMINLLFAKLHRMLIDEWPSMVGDLPWVRRVLIQTEQFDNGIEFNPAATWYDRDDNTICALDQILRAEDHDAIAGLLGELTMLYSPFGGGESLELRLSAGQYVLIV
jgi:hypothetical protein